MTRQNHKLRTGAKPSRTVQLHARFMPGGLDAEGQLAFTSFFADAIEFAAGLRDTPVAPVSVRASKPNAPSHSICTSVVDCISALAKAAAAGDAQAAKYLAELATHAAGMVLLAERMQPELLRNVAKTQLHWPILAGEDTGWEKGALKRMERLELGADLRWFKARFRKARGNDAHLPARLWAKGAVRTIEETRFRFLSYGGLLSKFGSNEALADFCLAAGWDFGQDPKWVGEAVKLKAFSQASLAEWKSAIRKMIREEVPEFHERQEWATQRHSAIERGRGTPGEIQNAILDDICSALARIAPPEDLPKSAC